DGTIDLAQSDALAHALSESPATDRVAGWNAAFDSRLARDDFAGSQLLLDRAELLGCHLESRERERRQEMLNGVLAARRSSLRFEIGRARRDVAQGAALGFLREQEHNDLLAVITSLETALGSSADFAGLETGVREV